MFLFYSFKNNKNNPNNNDEQTMLLKYLKKKNPGLIVSTQQFSPRNDNSLSLKIITDSISGGYNDCASADQAMWFILCRPA